MGCCLRLSVVWKEHRSEGKCGAKSQFCYCALEFSAGIVLFFSSFIYAWFGFELCIMLFSLVSIPST